MQRIINIKHPKVYKQKIHFIIMAVYKCFKCEKKIQHKNLETRFVCPNCGSKIFYKSRKVAKIVKAV